MRLAANLSGRAHDQMRPILAERADRIILVSILIIAAMLRGQYLFQPLVDAFSWREASTAMIADNFYRTSWNIFYPEVSWTGPGPSYQGREFQIYTYIVAILNAIFGWHDWFGRLVATGFGLVTVFSLHRLAALVWNERHAHVVALIYAAMPAAIMIDSSFLPDPAMLAFVTLGIWLFLKYWAGGAAWLLPVAALAFTLGALTKLPGLAAGAVVAYLVVIGVGKGQKRQRIPVILAMALGGATVFSYYSWAIFLGESYPPYHVAGSGYIWESGFEKFWKNAFFARDLWETAYYWFYGLPLIVLFVVGLWVPPPLPGPEHGKSSTLIWVPHIWLGSGLLVYLVAAREVSNNPWNLHVLSVPIAFFCARGALFLVSLGKYTYTSLATLSRAVFVVVATVLWSISPAMESMKRPYAAAAQEMGQRLATLVAPGDLVVAISPSVGDPIAIYYSRQRGWVFPPGGGEKMWSVFVDDDETAIAQLEELRALGAGWFAVAKNARDFKRRYFIEHHAGVLAYLDETATLVEDTDTYLIYRMKAD